ncbi:tryptophan ABC transporter substrate-binding protein [Furfurilactobacillus siliginis]|uniref:ABC transporter substrate-binding protein n=2 Tax=Furfurilactobacillus siliginis TaxID=348151 RepID=A0A510VQS4_9LACO|nr:tryptophan ABC transporter substrate-binding protein [Furfurilactobacillus siliginis]GEK29304.1 ABC transporter substrate-binding protein [Furfurilactobacillus siliginis]
MKRMYSLIAIILIFLGVAFVAERKQQAAQEKVPTVGVLQLLSHPALDAINRGIDDSIKAHGYKPGKDIHIDFQNAQGDQSNLQSMSARFVNEHVNVAIGIATPSGQALANATHKIPVVLGAVTNPEGAKLVKTNEHPGGNVTGVSDHPPLEKQLRLIKQLTPNLKTLGIIYTSSDDSAATQYRQFKALCEKQHIALKTYTIASTNDVNQVSQTMANEVDAVYVPTDNTIASAMQTLVKNTNAKKIPVFPGADTMVKQGGLATYSINQYKLGRHTGDMAVAILRHKAKPANTPIDFVTDSDLTVNLKAAKELGITVPQSLINEASKKGELYK